MDTNLNWLKSVALLICWFGQFLLPFLFAVTYSIRKKKAKRPITFWRIFIYVVSTTILSSFILNILTFIYFQKEFTGSGNFGGFVFILLFLVNIILSVIVAIVGYTMAKRTE